MTVAWKSQSTYQSKAGATYTAYDFTFILWVFELIIRLATTTQRKYIHFLGKDTKTLQSPDSYYPRPLDPLYQFN